MVPEEALVNENGVLAALQALPGFSAQMQSTRLSNLQNNLYMRRSLEYAYGCE